MLTISYVSESFEILLLIIFFLDLYPILNLFLYFVIEFLEFFTCFGRKTSIRGRVGENLFQFGRLLFCCIDGLLCLIETFQFNEVQFINADINERTVSVVHGRFAPSPMYSRLFPTFSSGKFSVFWSGFIWRSFGNYHPV